MVLQSISRGMFTSGRPFANLRLPNRVTTVLVSSVGLGIVLFGILLRRWLRNRSVSERLSSGLNDGGSQDVFIDTCHQLDRSEAVRASSRLRYTPSISDRGSVRQGGSSRHRNHMSTSMDPLPLGVVDSTQELLRSLERAVSVIETYRSHSEKHSNLFGEFTSIIDRLKVLESDIARLVAEGAIGDLKDDLNTTILPQGAVWSVHNLPHPGTLSVLSDDSFMSAYEEFAVTFDNDILRDELSIPENQLHLYKDGLRAANRGEVNFRKMRGDICQCENELDFAAKLWCLRKALELCLNDERRKMWLANAGRTLLGDILKHSKQDPAQFYTAFDALIEFFRSEVNVSQMEEELAGRGVVEFGFWDVVLDFILLDSFDDIRSPPSAVYSVTKNYFLSNSIKYSTIRTIIWSMLKAKRQRLKDSNGFIAHIYDISETVSPAITLGFLGTDSRIGELCQYFKEQVTQFVVDIFNLKRVRYTTVEALAEDVWIILESRAEALRTRLATELIPA
ncbi:unnamed protein product [Angiostrongylus costaricensis]|uniref:Mitoguardin n=1 Tax=Angiostrongylus costaricensis TaxID=334426 RepID=A0A158PDE7_ANGCS|nr:unnamed protein product [Angiostrongylus costaricensis]